ncbi:MAG TPA: patatin-like phospholipase family protein [Hanamia sp.]|nr:patatin-like phospholipase family protein [Hanamia sp.]
MSSPTTGTSAQKSITTEDFTNHPEVLNCINQLDAAFSKSGRQFIVSDVYDDEGNQYVNLVQKGGGVLGVALVGYTYILEKMGIRFVRLAGTSAGAINTALMTVIGEKKDVKSLQILKAICDLNFFDLVDGHPTAKWIIKKFITNEDFSVKVSRWIKAIVFIAIILPVIDFIFFGLQHKVVLLSIVTKIAFVLTGLYFLLIGALIFYSIRLLKRLKNAGFGINPGNYFYDWIKKLLIVNGVVKVSDLNSKATNLPKLYLRPGNPESLDTLAGDVTFIASELVTENKIQFPAMCNLFREEDEIDTLQPAGFIRASMAIPVFFESYFINNIPDTSPEVKKAWMDTFNEPNPPTQARFVDGGILSNFPINIFYNPKVVVPRLPSFGIDLDDSKPEDKSTNAIDWTIMGYLGRMFNTIRDYYDKDFLLKNKFFEKGIGKIPLSGYNWLNFFLSDKDKINMFVLGAKAATQFLIDFNWENYKNDREKMHAKLEGEKQ